MRLRCLRNDAIKIFDPPGSGRMGGHYFAHGVCMSVCTSTLTLIVAKTITHYYATWGLVGHLIRQTCCFLLFNFLSLFLLQVLSMKTLKSAVMERAKKVLGIRRMSYHRHLSILRHLAEGRPPLTINRVTKESK